jgi:hypothetical protein
MPLPFRANRGRQLIVPIVPSEKNAEASALGAKGHQ